MQTWLIFNGNQYIDQVGFDQSMEASEVFRELTTFLGYSPYITIEQAKSLTENQMTVLSTLRRRGAFYLAAATEAAWRRGQSYYLDPRCSARRKLMKAFNKGNREASCRT